MSAKRTVVEHVAIEAIARPEGRDLALDLPLLVLQPEELGFSLRQRTQVLTDERADRASALRCADPRGPVDIVRDGDRDVLHCVTVSRFLRCTVPQKERCADEAPHGDASPPRASSSARAQATSLAKAPSKPPRRRRSRTSRSAPGVARMCPGWSGDPRTSFAAWSGGSPRATSASLPARSCSCATPRARRWPNLRRRRRQDLVSEHGDSLLDEFT